MKLTLRKAAAGVAALFLASTAVVAMGSPAQAAYTPPWGNDPNSVAGLIFYNAAGAPISGGLVADASFAKYVQAAGPIRANSTKALIAGYTPVSGVAPGNWAGQVLTTSTTFPVASAPTNLKESPLPVVAPPAEPHLQYLADDTPNAATSGDYVGLYQVRLLVRVPGVAETPDDKYASSVIKITGATWTRVDDQPKLPSTTTVAVSAANVSHGTNVTLTSKISPVDAGGSIQFKDGSKVLGTVGLAGATATYSTKAFTNGTHQISAVYVPSASSLYNASSSAAKSLVVSAKKTSTTLTVSKKSVKKGKAVALKAKVSIPSAAGTVKFYDGKKLLKSVKVKGGKASFSTKKLKVGTHKLTAKFTPTNTADFTASTSAKKSVKVKKK